MKRYITTEVDISYLEPIESMSQIGIDKENNRVYYVNPDTGRQGEPYFKAYNNKSVGKASSIARISFLAPKYIFHRNSDGKSNWILSSKERKQMVEYLNKKSAFFNVTSWQYAMYTWNLEWGFFSDGFPEDKFSSAIDAYVKGHFDSSKNLEHPSYLQSTLIMPDYTKLQ